MSIVDLVVPESYKVFRIDLITKTAEQVPSSVFAYKADLLACNKLNSNSLKSNVVYYVEDVTIEKEKPD